MGALINSNRSLSARQASGEKRSRITDAADCAAPITVEVAALQCGGREQPRPRMREVGRRGIPRAEQRADLRAHPRGGLVAVADAVDQGPNEPQRRLDAFHVASNPKQIGGRAARQWSRAARNADPIRRRPQRCLGDRLIPEDPPLPPAPPPFQAPPPPLPLSPTP